MLHIVNTRGTGLAALHPGRAVLQPRDRAGQRRQGRMHLVGFQRTTQVHATVSELQPDVHILAFDQGDLTDEVSYSHPEDLADLYSALLADEKGTIAKAFGVPTKAGAVFKFKGADGQTHTLKRGVTASRWTFVIDKQGKIALKETKVNAAEDAKAVAAAVESLK